MLGLTEILPGQSRGCQKHLDEIRAREEEELSDYCSDRDGGRYDAEVANGRGYYDASGKFHYHHVPNDEW